jgi:DNA repair exonuclease SbcCD ATPase subunit
LAYNLIGDYVQIEFKKLTYSNLMSYGAETTEIDFGNKLNLISGTNGVGKTATLEALTYCLFGKAYRKIKIAEIVNWRNKGNLKTSCTFVINGLDTYKITRTLSPDSLTISKNDKNLELLSHKKLTQEEINKILGVNYEVFKATIALSISYNQPFLSLDPKGKRTLVEQSFGIAVFGKMLEGIKKRISDTKKNGEMARFAVENLDGTIESLKEQYLDLIKVNEDFETDKKRRIIELEETIEKAKLNNKEQVKTKTELTEKNQKNQKILDKIDKKSLQTKDKTVQKKLNEIDYAKKDYDKKIKLFKENSNCPTCKAPIDEEVKKQELKAYDDFCLNYESDREKFLKVQETVSEDIKKIEKMETEIYENEHKLKVIQKNIEHNIMDIGHYDKELTKVQEHKNEINLKNFEKTIADKMIELDKKKDDCSLLNKDAVTLKLASGVLSEEGVRTYVIDKILPLLNKKINEYLDIFELPVKIIFNKQMEEKIINLRNFRTEVSYYSCSEGEKKRIDFAMLLSFIETMKIVSNWNCNLLMIDELLDSSIDETGLEKMIQTLYKISAEKGIGIYVISHRISTELKSYFSSIIKIKKDDNDFSTIERG